MSRLLCVALGSLLFCCRPNYFQIQSEYAQGETPPPPAYDNRAHWAALPTLKDAADSVPNKSSLKDQQAEATADVFFIHPTTFTHKPTNQFIWNADVNDAALNRKTQESTILNQASIFNGSCRVYAPYYRQAHYHAFVTTRPEDARQALDLAYEDVKAAFEYYLTHYNQGRPLVLAAHSQGTVHAVRLLKDFFDGKELRKQLVVAYLVGRAISPAAFATIIPTEKPDETGVWASWCTFGRDYYPDRYDDYYKGSQSTNPLLWNSSKDFAPKELNLGGVGYRFTFAPQMADAQNQDGILWINRPNVQGARLVKNTNWHRADMNLFYMNIRENVKVRIDAWWKMNP